MIYPPTPFKAKLIDKPNVEAALTLGRVYTILKVEMVYPLSMRAKKEQYFYLYDDVGEMWAYAAWHYHFNVIDEFRTAIIDALETNNVDTDIEANRKSNNGAGA